MGRRLLTVVASGPLVVLASLTLAAQSAAPLADAARRGDQEAVRRLVADGLDVKAGHADGMTPLHWAAERGDAELARVLIAAGAEIGAVTRIGHYTPLHLASRTGSVDAVRALLEAGAGADVRTSTSGVTPLHLAAASGSADVVAALTGAGADPDARESSWGQTPLIFAASLGRVEAIRALLARGADPNLASEAVDLVEQQALDREATQLQRRILSSVVPEGMTPTASQQQAAIEAARELYRTGRAPEPDRPDGQARRAETGGSDPAQPGNTLNDEGPPPAIAYKGGLTPLHHAARQGHLQAVLALLEGGAGINRTSGDGHTPVLVAAINGQFDVAMLLVERGADPNVAAEGNGVTPLWAVVNAQWQPRTRYPQPQEMERQRATYLDVMKALLEAGADPNARLRMHPWYMVYTGCGNGNCGLTNTAGSTAFWRAAYGTDVAAMRLLVEYGADPNIPTIAPPPRRGRAGRGGGREESATDPSGLPPVPPGGPGVYPIHAAAGVEYGEGFAGNAHRHVPDGWLAAVTYLVEELGADINMRDNDGYNALHHAAARGDNAMILYLVSKGADVTAVSRRGQTTADMANGPVQRVSPFPETVALLEKLGSKNNHRCVSCAP